MRDLTADEREIVAGGWMVDEYEEGNDWHSQRFAWRDYYAGGPLRYYIDANGRETVVAYGSRSESGMSFFWNPNAPASGNGGGGGGGEQETPRDTPCVTDKPTGVALMDLHKAAIELKKAEVKSGNSFYENAGLIYRIPGEEGVRWTVPVHTGSERGVSLAGAVAQLPPGVVIVGMYHSQPARDGNLSSIMSPEDWAEWSKIFDNSSNPVFTSMSGLVAQIGKGITADPNGLSYIYDKKTGNIHVYDRSDKGSDKQQCHVNNRGG